MKKTFNTVLQKKDWVLLAALVVAIVALVLLITPKEETVDTITVIPPPAQMDVIGEDILEPAPVAAIADAPAVDIASVPLEDRYRVLQQPPTGAAVEAMQVLSSAVVSIPDPNLKAALNTLLGRTDLGLDITESDMAGLLTRLPVYTTAGVPGQTPTQTNILDLRSKGITNITGLEKLVPQSGFMITLDLGDNRITDLTPLKDLTAIAYLNVKTNQITDLKPLANLKGMEELYVSHNRISDISVVSLMPRLHILNANDNQITSAEGLRAHYMTDIDLSNNRLGKLVMDQYMASPTTYAVPNPLSVAYNYININDPRDFSVALNTGTATLWPQYKIDMFDMNNNIVMYIVEMGSEKMNFKLMRRTTTDGVTFSAPELIPAATIVPAYPRDDRGKEEKHVVDFTFDPATGILTAIPKSYGDQYVTFYLYAADGSYSRVTVDFHILMSK